MAVVRALLLAALLLVCSPPAEAQKAPPDFSIHAILALINESPRAFTRTWEGRYRAAGRQGRTPALSAEYARGFIDYAYFHWRETGRQLPARWRPLERAVGRIDINDPALLALPEQQGFLQSWLRHRARQALRDRTDLQIGDNRWLRARFFVAETQVSNNEVRRFLLRAALADHIEENTAVGVPELINRFAALTSAPESDLAPLREAARQDLALRNGHRIEHYKQIDGIDLEAHIFAPATTSGARPALIWFHGGSWATGSWSHCPIVCRQARELNYVTIQIEFRTADRFDATPMEAINDARDAVVWVRSNAARLGIDAERLIVAGFSSGGSIATFLAATSAPHDIHAALLLSACTAPLNDAWFRRILEDRYAPETLSPIAHLDAGDAAIFAIHGAADEACPFADTEGFVAQAADAGLDAQLEALPNASHFFVFNNPPARDLAIQRVREALARWRDEETLRQAAQ